MAMTSRNDRKGRPEPTRTARVVFAGGLVAFAAGAIAWIWVGDWRFGVTGLMALPAAIATVAVLSGGNRKQ